MLCMRNQQNDFMIYQYDINQQFLPQILWCLISYLYITKCLMLILLSIIEFCNPLRYNSRAQFQNQDTALEVEELSLSKLDSHKVVLSLTF